MAKEPQSELKEKIRKEIENSGFPLELYVLGICSTKNTGRLPNTRYIHENKLRELDLRAFFENIEVDSRKNLQHTVTSMIIECKKSKDRPWVFFSSHDYQSPDVLSFIKYNSEFDNYFAKTRNYLLLGQIFKNLKKNHYCDKNIPRCIAYSEAFKNERSTPSQIYDAVDSVLSYTRHAQSQRNDDLEEYGTYTEFYFPVIERKHLQLRTDYDDGIFIIDVVVKDYFEQFFQIIEDDHKEFVKAIDKIKFPIPYKKMLKIKMREKRKERLPLPIELYGYTKNEEE